MYIFFMMWMLFVPVLMFSVHVEAVVLYECRFTDLSMSNCEAYTDPTTTEYGDTEASWQSPPRGGRQEKCQSPFYNDTIHDYLISERRDIKGTSDAPAGFYNATIIINTSYGGAQTMFNSLRMTISLFFWNDSISSSLLEFYSDGYLKMTWDSRAYTTGRWFRETIELQDKLPSKIRFVAYHNASNTCSGIAMDDIVIEDTDSRPGFSSTMAPSDMTSDPDATMEILVIALVCAVGGLLIIITILLIIIFKRQKRGSDNLGVTVANSTYDLPSTISGINTSTNRYFKYGTYSGERYPPVSPGSETSSPIVKFPKKKLRRGLTLPSRSSQQIASFDYRGVSGSSSPQSPDSVGRMYVQKRPKQGLLSRAQAMIYGLPKPMNKRLSRSLPDNLEWTLSGNTRGPYQVTDLLNGRIIELGDNPMISDESNLIDNIESTPSAKSPRTTSPPFQAGISYNSKTESVAIVSPKDTIPPHTSPPPTQHTVTNEHFRERTLDRSRLTLPLNVKRPSWDSDSFPNDKCELLDLLHDPTQSRETTTSETYSSTSDVYEPVRNPDESRHPVSRNDNRKPGRGSDSSSPLTSSNDDSSSPSPPGRDEVYEMVSPVDEKPSNHDGLGNHGSGSPMEDVAHDTGSPSVRRGNTYCGKPSSLKKKSKPNTPKRTVSFSNKPCIIEGLPADEYDEVELDNEGNKSESDGYDNPKTMTTKSPSFKVLDPSLPNSGYVNVGTPSEDSDSATGGRDEYEMISPTKEKDESFEGNRHFPRSTKSNDDYDELSRDFPLSKNPRSKEKSGDDDYNTLSVMPDLVPKVVAKKPSLDSDYDNVGARDSGLLSPEGGQLHLYHFTPDSTKEAGKKNSDPGNNDVYEEVAC